MKRGLLSSLEFLVFNFLYKGIMSVANESSAILKFTKVSENAFAPIKGSDKAAGYDLKSAYDYTVPAHGKELIKTDISIELPHGKYKYY